ncbi:hypothetical protein [Pseudomonas sp. CC120222-01a]|uniref:hypothetical protein n=1 Tax=Pseudomonas sp. CC120222-01a TaxID=1378075 RepID=UPI000D844AD7|nr:hypothetical protein [Pseudomonas sp. CC120222-01a]PVZ42584.1 hypothetical protein N430_01197 [Pseudomonas sp. CC120222-01a]
MRVPVLPSDLAPKSGLKRLEKALQKRWCGARPITLSGAREILSKGLGYRDYRDLYETSKIARIGTTTPLESEVRSQILSAIKVALKPQEWIATDLVAWEKLVTSLPVNSLSAFTASLHIRTHDRHISSFGSSAAHLDTAGDFKTHRIICEQLERISRYVAASGDLRDAALLACLVNGIRPYELLSAKIDQNSTFTCRALIDINLSKKLKHADTRGICTTEFSAIEVYIKAMNLSQGDYLFPAAVNSGACMTSNQLSRICESWAVKAGIEGSTSMLSRIRTLAIYKRFLEFKMQSGTSVDYINWRLGHMHADALGSYSNKRT